MPRRNLSSQRQTPAGGRQALSVKGVAIRPPAPDLSSVHIRSAAAQALCSLLGRSLDGVPDEPLLAKERTTLGGSLFPTGPLLIATLTEELLAAPGWYPELQERARYLAARQQEASSWGLLRRLLAHALDLVSDHHLRAQAECNQEGLAIVKQIEAPLRATSTADPERALDRIYGIARTRVVLRDYRDQPPPPRPKQAADEDALTPRQRTARQQRQALIKARLYGAFQHVLRTWRTHE